MIQIFVIAFAVAAQKPDTQQRLMRFVFGDPIEDFWVDPTENDVHAGEQISGLTYPTNFPTVTNLTLWGVLPTGTSVVFGVAWPRTMDFTNDYIDAYGNWQLSPTGWLRFSSFDVISARSNAVFEADWHAALTNAVAEGLFPTNATSAAGFFRLSDQSDSDGDGLTLGEECFTYGTDPTLADTDGDGLPDRYEIETAGTDPLRMDTDGDGLLDCVDSHPLAGDGDCYGQSADWVAATFENSAEILAIGYTDWVDQQVGVGLVNGLYKITVAFTNAPTTMTLLSVGDRAVTVTNAGEFVFLCKKGVEYAFRVHPACSNVECAVSDDMAEPSQQTLRSGATWGSGHWSEDGDFFRSIGSAQDGSGTFIWLPLLVGTPDVVHLHLEDMPKSFYASVSDICPDVSAYYFWSTDNDRIQISDPTARHVMVSANEIPSFDYFDLSVRADFGSWSLVSTINATYGTNNAPRVHTYVTVPSAILHTGEGSGAESNRKLPVAFGFTADVQTNGTVRLEASSGAGRIRLWRNQSATGESVASPIDVQVSDSVAGGPWTYYIQGISPSASMNDVVLKASFMPIGESAPAADDCATSSLTVVEPQEVVLPDAPPEGLAVVVGDTVDFDLAWVPGDYDGSHFSCDWYVGQRKSDGSYEEWSLVAARVAGPTYLYHPPNAGVFRLKAVVTLGYDSKEVHYVHAYELPYTLVKAGDEDHFGVASTEKLLALRNKAVEWVGNSAFSLDAELSGYDIFSAVPAKEWKCNAFVAHVAILSGVAVPVRYETGLPLIFLGGRYPPLANDWAVETDPPIAGWNHLGTSVHPEPGMVIGHPNPHGPGHCGIVDYDGIPVSAGRENVNKKYYQFLDGLSGYNIPIEEEQ